MATSMYLKMESDKGPVEGESQVAGFEKQIIVLAYNWGLSQTGTTHHGTGGGAGKVNVQDLSFTHWVDAATPALIQACCKGTHFSKATLSCTKAGGDSPVVYLVVEMKDLIVSSVSCGGSNGEDMQSVNVTLNFAEFTIKYQPQDKTGKKLGGTKDATFAISKNS